MKKYLLIPSLILSLAVSIGFGVLKQQSDFLILLTKQLAQYQKVASEEKTYLHVDRSFYTVGDDIWFKGYLLDGTSHAFSQLSDLVYVELLSPKGNVLAKLKLPVNSGIYHGDFALPANAPGGIYQVLAYTEWMKNAGEETFFRKKIQVQNVVIPRLLMTMDFQQKAYGPGATVHADLSIRDLQDQPIARTSFDITAAINGKTYLTKTLQTDKEGKAVITFNLPENLQSNDGLLALKFNYEGTYESISRSIPIVLNNIDLQFFPEGGNLLANQQNRVAFKAINEFGKGADVSGEILDSEGNVVTTFESYHMGMGSVSFTPNAAEQYVAKITAPVQLAKQYALPKSNQQAYGLALSERSSKGLIFNYFTPNNEAVNVVAQVRGKVYDAQTIRATKGMNQLTIPIHDFPTGIAQITLFNAAGQPQCERLAFVNANKKLNVSLQTDKKEYEPREKVELSIRTTDHLGKPVPTNLSLAVVDDKIVSFADDKQDHILSWMLMSSDLKGTVEEPSFYFKSDEPKAAQALDLVMMTHGWRRFNWKEITSKNIKLAHTAETFDVIQGQLVQHQSHRPIAGKVYLIEMEEEGRMVE
ncbi:MAG: MG2 domain-containing protein, partial [Flammeovirgaceae bacterium]